MRFSFTLICLLGCNPSWAEQDPTGAPFTPHRQQTTPETGTRTSIDEAEKRAAASAQPASSSARLDAPDQSHRPPNHSRTEEVANPSTPNANQRLPITKNDYRFELISNECISSSAFSVKATHGLAPQGARWFIKTPSRIVNLQSLPANEVSTIKLKLQQTEFVQPNLAHPLYVQLPNETSLTHSQLSVKVCSPELNHEFDSPHSGELLILLDQIELNSFINYAKKHAINVIERIPLHDKKILITIKPKASELAQIAKQLRDAFPKLQIDSNDYLTQAGTARTYAKAQINWPKEICQKHRLPIGIIDGPHDVFNTNLQGKNIVTKAFVDDSIDDPNHATAISVILTGNQQDPALDGLINDADLYIANVMEKTFFGNTASVSAIAQALAWLSSSDVRLVNISLSGKKPNRVLETITKQMSQKGMLIFAAVGNNADTKNRYYPAAFDSVIAVTAIDAANRLYKSANQGDYIDFAAPGVDIWTADNIQNGKYRSGTSYATPFVVAAAANLLSLNPRLPKALIYQSLKASVVDLGQSGRDHQFGWGMIQYTDTCQ